MKPTRGGRIVLVVLLVLTLAGIGRYAYRAYNEFFLTERCTVRTPQGEVSLSPEQTANAATIAGVALRRRLPERAVVVALATAMQESKLRNLEHGDRDSLGLFQQRPSMGWGTPEQILDPVYASGKFYQALVEVPRYRALPVSDAAQRVQRSAAPSAYARHENMATVLAAALTGREATALTCRIRTDPYSRQEMGRSGLTPRSEAVRRELTRTFGKLSLGGFTPGGVRTGHIAGSAHYEGRAIDVLYRPVSGAKQRQAWAVAQWAVGQADEVGITEVIYNGKIWTARRSNQGWRDYTPPSGRTTNPTLMHRDHVHLTIARGTR